MLRSERGGDDRGEARVVGEKTAMKLQTRVFELYNRRYTGLPELARAMEISVSQIYRVRQGKRPVSEKFINGAIKAFPGYNLDDLFYVAPDGSQNDYR